MTRGFCVGSMGDIVSEDAEERQWRGGAPRVIHHEGAEVTDLTLNALRALISAELDFQAVKYAGYGSGVILT